MKKYEKILVIIKARVNRKQEPAEDYASYNAKIQEARVIYKAILNLPPVL